MAQQHIQVLSTGTPALDRTLDGGIPAYSVSIIAGEPGSGKTILALQMLFALARQGKKCIYFTTLSEPAVKLIRYMQAFTFFDQSLIDKSVTFADLGNDIRSLGVQHALEQVAQRIEEELPDIVVIDSFKAVHDLIGDPATSRALIYDLVVHMAGWGATTFLVGEYSSEEMGAFPEFAIVDGIIYLSAPRREFSVERQIEVRKLRGAAYETGIHFFTIGNDGLTFYPRVKAPPPEEVSPSHLQGRATTGAAGLDEMLGGGFPRLTSTMIEGGTGTGKTVFSMQFIVEGARRGEPGLYLTLEETPSQLRALGNVFGWNVAELESKDLMTISYTSPVELSTDAYLNEARKLVEKTGARRAVLDSLSSLQLSVISERRFKELVYAITRHFNAAGVTFLTTMEIPELLGSTQLTGLGTSSMADNIIMLRYVESGGRLDHALSVLKARGIAHETQVRRYAIASGNGFTVGEPFQRLRGVLTGIPVPTDETK